MKRLNFQNVLRIQFGAASPSLSKSPIKGILHKIEGYSQHKTRLFWSRFMLLLLMQRSIEADQAQQSGLLELHLVR